MRSHNRTCAILSLLSCLVWGCAPTNAPRDWLASPEGTPRDVRGGWVKLQYTSAAKAKAQISGELIAISGDSLFIANDALQAIALSNIKSAQLEAYRSNSAGMGGLVFLGTLSTISNGLLLIFTAPVWIIGGSIATSARSFEPIIKYPKQEWSRFSPFARYPQGLPVGLARQQIKMRPRK